SSNRSPGNIRAAPSRRCETTAGRTIAPFRDRDYHTADNCRLVPFFKVAYLKVDRFPSRMTNTSPTRASGVLTAARIDLASALRFAAQLGLHEGVCNHFSLSVPLGDGTEGFLINPRGMLWSEVLPSVLVLVDC